MRCAYTLFLPLLGLGSLALFPLVGGGEVSWPSRVRISPSLWEERPPPYRLRAAGVGREVYGMVILPPSSILQKKIASVYSVTVSFLNSPSYITLGLVCSHESYFQMMV